MADADEWLAGALADTRALLDLWGEDLQRRDVTDREVVELREATDALIERLRERRDDRPAGVDPTLEGPIGAVLDEWEVRQDRLVPGIPRDVLLEKADHLHGAAAGLESALLDRR